MGIGGENLCIPRRDFPAPLTLQRTSHYRSATGRPSVRDESVDEVNEVVRQADGDLLAHPRTVPNWDAF